MRMIMRIKSIHRLCTKLPVSICGCLTVIDKDGSNFFGSIFGVPNKAVGGVGIVAGLPDVVGRGAGDNDVGAFEAEQRGRVGEVAGICKDVFGAATLVSLDKASTRLWQLTCTA